MPAINDIAQKEHAKNSSLFKNFIAQINAFPVDMVHSLPDDSIDHILTVLAQDYHYSKTYLDRLHNQYQKTKSVSLPQVDIDLAVVKKLPKIKAHRWCVLPLYQKSGTTVVAMANPFDTEAITDLMRYLETGVTPMIADQKDIKRYIDRYYPFQDTLQQQAGKIAGTIIKDITPDLSALQSPSVSQEKVVKLLDEIITVGIERQASDIHLEAQNKILRLFYRVDGTLQEMTVVAPRVPDILLRRLKILANLDITSTYLPQDGSFTYQAATGKNRCSIRLSVMQTKYGFSAVMRVANITHKSFSLSENVTDKITFQAINDFLHKKEGMMLITGPTGSGKTTTLYAALTALNTGEAKIIAIEDPVEFPLERICQVEVNEDAGLSFATVLRAVLRQDPDVIMLGEIRDEVSAQIAVRSAVTGHKLFSTLHTKNTVGTIERLLDLNIDSFFLAEALNLIIAQRLLKCVCPHCKHFVPVDQDTQTVLDHLNPNFTPMPDQVAIGKGCDYCSNSGLLGRAAVYESLAITPELSRAIALRNFDQIYAITDELLKEKLLIDSAFRLLSAGTVSVAEVCRL